MFKVNNKDTKMTSTSSDFTQCSGVSIANSESVNAGCDSIISKRLLNYRINENACMR